MRVCVYTRAWRGSGAGLFAQSLVDGLIESGATVTYVCPSVESAAFEQPRPRLERLRPPRERTTGSRLSRALASVARIAGSFAALARARRRNRVFIVTIPDPLVFSVPMLALLRLSGAQVIFVAHDPLPHAWKLPAALRGLERATHGACYHLANAVVVLSAPSAARLHEAFPGVRAPVKVIEHGVFPLARRTGMPGSRRLLVFGTLRRNKGVVEAIEGVIEARRQGIDVQLVVAGGIHPEDRAYADLCRSAAAAAPEAVELRIGYVDDQALEGLFESCDALLMPYGDFHSQSGVALLAASNARPVIATPAGGLGALIAEGMPAVPIAMPPTATGVASAVRMFFDVPVEQWRTRAEAYRERTFELRGWPVIGRQYLDLAGQLARAASASAIHPSVER